MQGVGRIWLIGGTQESAELARIIAQADLECVISVTTEAARSLYPNAPELQIWVGRLNQTSVQQFCLTHQITAILDASHPFAVEISELAIATATDLQLPYLRYERPILKNTPHSTPHTPHPTLHTLSSIQSLLQTNLLLNQRVLLTIGYRPLALFQPWQERATLFARILPSVTALEAAIAAGFTPDRLIAIRPPILLEMERALWQQWQISLVVTKAAGAPGGEDMKRQVSAELGVTLVVIDRPSITYPQQTSDLQTALAFCQQFASTLSP